MRDIARIAGVHQTTVSRALRNDDRLPESTRARIRAIAEQLGYRTNPLVAALVAARRLRHPSEFQPTLAYVVWHDSPDREEPPRRLVARREYLRGARSAAENLGFKVEEFVLGAAGLSEERLNQVLRTRSIHGLILAPLREARGQYTLDWPRFATVVIEFTFAEPAFDRVVHDSYGGMRQIMAECRRRDVRRVGLLLRVVGHERTERANGGAFWIEQKADDFFAPIPPLILPEWDDAAFARWMRGRRPEAIVTSNDLLEPVQHWCAQNGVTPGGDLQLINVNAIAGAGVAGIYQDPFGIGATAARLAIEKIIHNEWGVPERRQTVQTTGVWMEGATLRPLRESGVPSAGVSATGAAG
jgi:LacI family transcriptional regulator/LacI family fructose operon transcriptional repressor